MLPFFKAQNFYLSISVNLIESSCSVIQSYIHQYVWLLYSSLTLSVANVLYSKHQEHVECDFIKSATQLYNHCIEKASDFMSTLQLSQSNLSGLFKIHHHHHHLQGPCPQHHVLSMTLNSSGTSKEKIL